MMIIEDTETLANIERIKSLYLEQTKYIPLMEVPSGSLIVSHAIKKFLGQKQNHLNERIAVLRDKKKWLPVLYTSQQRLCHYCSRYISEYMKGTLDHKQPLSRGGRSDFSNLAFSCALCNNEKDSMTEEEYLLFRAEKYGINQDTVGGSPVSSAIEGFPQDMALGFH